MPASLPDKVDVWRMVAERRLFEGAVPLAALGRLAPSLADTEGECRYALEFGRDEHGGDFVELRAEAALPLTCQRSLERFEQAVAIRQRLGLIRSESDEAALQPGVEPVLVPDDGRLSPLALVEDELILAVPLVPIKPGSEERVAEWGAEAGHEAGSGSQSESEPGPFAVLAQLKKSDPSK